MLSAFLIDSLAINSYAVIASGVTRELSLSASESGLLMSITMFAYGLAIMPIGAVTCRYSRKWLLFIAVGLIGTGCVLFSVLDNYIALLFARSLIGLGAAFVLPVTTRIQAEVVPVDKRQQSTGITAAGWGLGLLGTFFGLSFVFNAAGWRLTVIVIAAFAILAMLLILVGMKGVHETIEEPAPWSKDDIRSFTMNRGITCLMLINFSLSAISAAIITWVPAHIQSSFGSTVLISNIMMGAFSMGQFVSSCFGGAVSVRFGRRLVFLSSAGISMITPVLIALAPNQALILIFMGLYGWFSMFQFGPLYSSVSRFASGRIIPLAASYISAVGFGLSLITPWIFGWFLDVSGSFLYGFIMLSVIGIAGVAGAIFVPVEAKAELVQQT
jgi:MFS family permease